MLAGPFTTLHQALYKYSFICSSGTKLSKKAGGVTFQLATNKVNTEIKIFLVSQMIQYAVSRVQADAQPRIF